MKKTIFVLLSLLLLIGGTPAQNAAKRRVLLLWQGPDGHPAQSHEYELGQKLLAKFLQKVPDLEVTLVKADEPWRDGPEILAKADGVVMYLSEGAKWTQADPKRAAAFTEFAKRGGGIAVLHWAMGTKDAKDIEPFLQLAGGCHGGPDRKYKFLSTDVHIMDTKHPITRGLKDFKIRDEFYYQLKFVKAKEPVTQLLQADIDGQRETVAWAWQRPGGGRSFGFSGLHYHENWDVPEYRRLIVQGVVWAMGGMIPEGGLKVP